jgi:hypothetical protein
MKYIDEIQSAGNSPQKLEDLFQAAKKAGEGEYFHMAMDASYKQTPENLLYTAWHYRLEYQPETTKTGPNWMLAAPIGAVTGLIFWLLSDTNLMFLENIPYLVLFWAPIATLGALAFLARANRRDLRRYLFAGLGLTAASLFVLLIAPTQSGGFHRFYLELMAIHLPLLSWIALGFSLLGRGSTSQNRFAFLTKSIEVAITAGLYLIFGVVFGMITIGLFQALNIDLPDEIMRLIAAGGFGLLPVLALASMYDPTLPPERQDFSQGLSKFTATMMRLLLPLTLLVLSIYILVIPFNFMQPFGNRDLLIIYNIMLFAIMGLLMGVTPIHPGELSTRLSQLLRRGVLLVIVLTILISLYALSATVFRTIQGGITINRLTIIGWNTINIGLLALLLFRQIRTSTEHWADRIKQVFSLGMTAYVAWVIFLIVAIPLLFR